MFVSSISAYAGFEKPNDENSPTGKLDDPSIEEVTGETYGPMKALCEQYVREAFAGRASIVRPGYIVGPLDPTDRFTYWPVRVSRGGEMLAPGTPRDPVQVIDVRDLTAWMLKLADTRATGNFNAISKPGAITIGDIITASQRASAQAGTKVTWVSEDFLNKTWKPEEMDLPPWTPTKGEYAGASLTASHASCADRAQVRPLQETVRDTLAWFKTLPAERQAKLKAGLDPKKEAETLAAWHQSRSERLGQVISTAFHRLLHKASEIRPYEVKAVSLSFVYFFFLLGSYYILRPLRDAMGTVYGVDDLEVLWTYTFIFSFIAVPVFGFFASRMRLSALLPWTYGFFVINILIFYVLFEHMPENRTLAGVFYCWTSVFNMLIVSVFWSFMADIFSRQQAKRIFGFVAAGGSVGAVAGPSLTAVLVNYVSTNTLLPISAFGFVIAIAVVILLEREKAAMAASGALAGHDFQPTQLAKKLGGNPFSGFSLVVKSPYLTLIAAMVLMLTWVSTILYFEQADHISKAFATREARTQAFALVDVAVNVGAIMIQLFGTSRLVLRFGITSALMLVPALMLFAFVGVAAVPLLSMLLGVQIVRRVAEYAVARPGREMLFTVVDQESKYKAKNVIDTVVYRFGDLSSAWLTGGLKAMGAGTAGAAAFGAVVCVVWGAIAWKLDAATRDSVRPDNCDFGIQ